MIAPLGSSANPPRLASPSPAARPQASPSPAARPQASPSPADVVTISGTPAQPRPIFAEAAALGLMVAGASVNSPLSAVLSEAAQKDLVALLKELEAGGLRFAHHPNPNASLSSSNPRTAEEAAQRILQTRGRFSEACLTASRAPEPGRAVGYGNVDMNLARFGSFTDLQNLEAIAVRRDPSASTDPALARSLLQLEEAGNTFYIDPNREKREPDSGAQVRRVGAYGAFRALTVDDGWGDGQAVYAGPQFEGRSAVRGPEDIAALAFFSGASDALASDPRAVALRDLTAAGYTLHTSMQKPQPPSDFFGGSMRPPQDDLMSPAGAWRTGQGYVIAGVLGVGRERVTLGSGPSADLQELAAWQRDRMPAGLSNEQQEQCLEAVASPMGRQPLATRARLLESLLPDAPLPVAIDSARAVAETDDVDASLARLLDLRKTLAPGIALEAWRHERKDGRDERLLAVAAACDTLDEAKRALDPISRAGFDDGLRIFGDLSRVHTRLGGTGRVDRALSDLDLALAHRRRDESVSDAAHVMMGLHDTVGRHGGWQASRDAFTFLQDNEFPRSREETLQLFVSTFAHRKDLEAARRAVMQPPKEEGRIVVDDGSVVIGGIRVPRR